MTHPRAGRPGPRAFALFTFRGGRWVKGRGRYATLEAATRSARQRVGSGWDSVRVYEKDGDLWRLRLVVDS